MFHSKSGDEKKIKDRMTSLFNKYYWTIVKTSLHSKKIKEHEISGRRLSHESSDESPSPVYTLIVQFSFTSDGCYRTED